jgi:hypothetical protein
MEDFIELGRRVTGMSFDLYAIGHDWQRLVDLNRSAGEPVRVHEPLPFSMMPAIYKRHRWLAYTACPVVKTVGWPMAIAEAQASGTMVCMANIRPDLRECVGDAGFLYDRIDEAASILEQPIDARRREAGFDQARLSDIQRHKHLLTERWQPHLH